MGSSKQHIQKIFEMKLLLSFALSFVLLTSAQAQLAVSRVLTVQDYPQKGQNFDVTADISSDAQVRLMGPPVSPGSPSSLDIHFSLSDIPQLENLLKKSLEWKRIALQNKVQPFSKEIGRIGYTTIMFQYYDTQSSIRLLNLNINVEQAPIVLKILSGLPPLEKELEEKVALAKKENALFQ
jgi:hypothetical protein